MPALLDQNWSPGPYAVHVDKWHDPEAAAPISIVASHLTAPCLNSVAAVDGAQTVDALHDIAFDYLNKLLKLEIFEAEDAALLKAWVEMLDAKSTSKHSATFAWTPLAPKDGLGGDPLRTSVQFERSPSAQGKRGERTVVLVATQAFPTELDNNGGKAPVFLGSEFGIRIVLHLKPAANENRYDIRITGMSAALPFGPYRDFSSIGAFGAMVQAQRNSLGQAEADSILDKMITRTAQRLQLKEDQIYIHGLRLGSTQDGLQAELRGTGESMHAKGTQPHYGFVVRGFLDGEDDVSVYKIEKFPLTANAVPGTARVFKKDPQSSMLALNALYRERAPTRSGATKGRGRFELDDFREEEGDIPDRAGDALQTGDFQVVYCPDLVREDEGKSGPKIVTLDGTNFPPVRSNDFSALSAYVHVKRMFKRMNDYGLNTVRYFRAAKRPVIVHYRSGISPGSGKDGKTVNARVQAGHTRGYLPKHAALVSETDNIKYNMPTIALHLALGNLSHRARKPWDRTKSGVNASAAQPLGVAVDERWLWHEFGHILLMANFGELELRFVHSPGDALAAIACDPHSRLATNAELRGATYPWVFIPRRHDRNVLKGWSWAADRSFSRVPAINPRMPTGYTAEQILSSTLFRMYRCLGGDTLKAGGDGPVPDQDAREEASHYSLYLTMAGLQLLALPPNHGECLADAFMQADVGTTPPFKAPSSTSEWVGGCAHKVIRWAFEAQGMYGADDDPLPNRPGRPPPVDIFIADHRPALEEVEGGQVAHGPGGYLPVSLDWEGLDGNDNVPRWHAPDDAISVTNDGIYVSVGNRGSEEAKSVTVRVWQATAPSNPSDLKWLDGNWSQCQQVSPETKNIGQGSQVKFGPFAAPGTGEPGTGKYVIFAEASCDDDPANIDAAAHLPCSTQPTALAPLVAGDNNIGLRIIEA